MDSGHARGGDSGGGARASWVPHGRLSSEERRVKEGAGDFRNKPSAPASIALVALGAGVVAGLLLVGFPSGVNWLVVAAAVAAAVVSVAWRRALPANALTFGALSLALTATAVHTATEWQLVLNLIVALGLASLAVASARTWTEFLLGFGAAGWHTPAALAWLLRVRHRGPAGEAASVTLPLARGFVLGGFLLVVFGALFASADQAFAQVADRILAAADVRYDLLPARLMVAGAVGLFTAALASFTPALGVGRGGPTEWVAGLRAEFGEPRKRQLGRTEWITALSMLEALFVLFVVVQITVLFGGREHVLDTSEPTYAEYARSGFFQLVTGAALTLLELGFFARHAQRTRSHDLLLLKILGGGLVALTPRRSGQRPQTTVALRGGLRLHTIEVGRSCRDSVARGDVRHRGRGRDPEQRSMDPTRSGRRLDAQPARLHPYTTRRFHRRTQRRAVPGDREDRPPLSGRSEPGRGARVSLRHELSEAEGLWSLNLARDTAREVLNNTPQSTSALQTCPYR
ncbi:MAG: DUF4173 domain-containing protein [Actinobacteria bacterium]|nr:DUF4173 domain-containing protein [Actinomycetota bacterium]